MDNQQGKSSQQQDHLSETDTRSSIELGEDIQIAHMSNLEEDDQASWVIIWSKAYEIVVIAPLPEL